jgi:hypothetical protein
LNFKTHFLGSYISTLTLAPTPYIKEETPTQHSNPRTHTNQQQQKSQHPNLPPRPHAYCIHRLFPMESGQKNKTDHEIISSPLPLVNEEIQQPSSQYSV